MRVILYTTMEVKIFSSAESTTDLENQIAEWTKDLNPEIHSVKLESVVLHDYYNAEHQTLAGMMCNHWIEYMAVVIYTSTIKTEH